MSKFIFQTIQFSISTQLSSIWPIDKILSVATTPSQSEPGNDSNKGVLCIAQISSITGASPSDCLMSHLGHLLGESNPSAEIQSVYSAAPADWASLKRKCWLCIYIYGGTRNNCKIMYRNEKNKSSSDDNLIRRNICQRLNYRYFHSITYMPWWSSFVCT